MDESQSLNKQLKENYKNLYEESSPSIELDKDYLEEHTPLLTQLKKIEQRYINRKLIAEGGMKQIFEVDDLKISRKVALAKPSTNLKISDYDLFLREGHITAKLSHPNIISAYDMGIDEDGLPFFTMELKKGDNLRTIINNIDKNNQSGFTPRQKLDIYLDICHAIKHAHDKKILHLDIKPENIQFASLSDIQLCDWGLSEILPTKDCDGPDSQNIDSDLYGRINNLKGGTHLYQAPEIKEGKAASIKSDIYSLGCLMIEWICLSPPQTPIEEIKKLNPSLKSIITKAKHENPSLRYDDINDMIIDIQRYDAGFSTLVETKNIKRELLLLYKRHRTLLKLSMTFVLIICLGTIISFYNINENKKKAEDALAMFLNEQHKSKRKLELQSMFALTNTSSLTSKNWALNPDTYPQVIEDAFNKVNHMITYQPPKNHAIWEQKFWLHFLVQDFETANSIELLSPQRIYDLIPLAIKYSEKLSESKKLNPEHLIKLFHDLNSTPISRHQLIYKILIYDFGQYRRSYKEKLKIISSLLQLYNPKWDINLVNYDNKTKTLKLTGPHLTALRYHNFPKNHPTLLNTIPIHHLALIETSIPSLDQIMGLNLLSLDISESKIQNIDALSKQKHLQSVTLSSEHKGSDVYHKLRDKLEFIFKP